MDDETKGRLMECFREYPPKGEHRELFGIGFEIRQKGYLTKEDYKKIVKWKQKSFLWTGKVESDLEKEDSEKVEKYTRKALSSNSLEEKVENLTELSQVGVTVASAILTAVRPEKYGVIDKNAWNALKDLGYELGEYKPVKVDNYREYLEIIRNIGDDLDLTPKEVDAALWEYGDEM